MTSVTDTWSGSRTVPHEGPIRWSMLLSHHPPRDFDHTVRLFGIRLCARCTGVFVGIVICWVCDGGPAKPSSVTHLAACLLVPMPALLDFTLHEIGWWRGHNLMRLLTGGLFGAAVGDIVHGVVNGDVWRPVVGCAWIGLLATCVGAIMKSHGVLDEFLSRYECAVRRPT